MKFDPFLVVFKEDENHHPSQYQTWAVQSAGPSAKEQKQAWSYWYLALAGDDALGASQPGMNKCHWPPKKLPVCETWTNMSFGNMATSS